MGNSNWGYIIEGYPRTLPQAEDIENQVKDFYFLIMESYIFSLAD